MKFNKLAPGLEFIYQEFLAHGAEGAAREAELCGLTGVDTTARMPRMHVFLEFIPEARLSNLKDHGAVLHAGGGCVRTATVPLESLADLSDDPEIEYIAPSHQVHACIDVAAVSIGIDLMRARWGNGIGNGEGVLIGIIDTGIDPTHRAFSGRIDRIWDQTLPGKGLPEGNFGEELLGDGILKSTDSQGHGTHVAGIAAGQDSQFMGVAPAAHIIVVKALPGTLGLSAGINYVFRIAGQLDMPAVVNVSWGSHGDAHDGTDPLSRMIDYWARPGRIVCCAAGNEGQRDIHAGVDISPGSSEEIAVQSDALPINIEAWCAAEAQLRMSVVSPSGQATPVEPLAPAPAKDPYTLPEGRARLVTRKDPGNQHHHMKVSIRPTSARPGYQWRLHLENVGTEAVYVDAWLANVREVREDVRFIGPGVVRGMRIGSPGAATSAITVASYTTRTSWRCQDGCEKSLPLTPGAISDFSSDGPRRDGAPKPDLAAPGAMIISCRSHAYTATTDWLIDDDYMIMGGTSMACPFVAGLAALMLERQPSLDPLQLKEIMRVHCVRAGHTPDDFDTKWGFGLIDASYL
ncbi:S8 family serine peptidase [Streptacidiphilus pinicola]|nr:S8 family serine peptidase [Streptacidiphilus pinicola]